MYDSLLKCAELYALAAWTGRKGWNWRDVDRKYYDVPFGDENKPEFTTEPESEWGTYDPRGYIEEPYGGYSDELEDPWWSQFVSKPRPRGKQYWGKKASGMLFLCREDGTTLLLKRSMRVENPGDWGIPGGAVGEGFYSREHGEEEDPEDKTFLSSAVKETWEEMGVVPKIGTMLMTTDFKDKSFTYRTYIYDIPLEEKERFSKQIRLNWENDYWFWFPFDDLPANLHKGVVFALRQLVGDVKPPKKG